MYFKCIKELESFTVGNIYTFSERCMRWNFNLNKMESAQSLIRDDNGVLKIIWNSDKYFEKYEQSEGIK